MTEPSSPDAGKLPKRQIRSDPATGSFRELVSKLAKSDAEHFAYSAAAFAILAFVKHTGVAQGAAASVVYDYGIAFLIIWTIFLAVAKVIGSWLKILKKRLK